MRGVFKSTLEKMRHYPNYATNLLIEDNSVMLGFSGYPDYPLKVFNKGNRNIVIEGKVYTKEDEEIADWLSTLSLNQEDLTGELSRFLLNTDGNFIIQVHDREQGLYLAFNDALGRLPTYYQSSSRHIIISKEVKFIIPFLDKVTFSRDALAEYLHFCYPLGNQTLLEDVYRLPPATFLLVDTKKQGFLSKSILSWNLDSEPIKQDKIDRNIGKLVSIFLDSLKRRTKSFATYKPVVSLSGGYDSRTVMAGLAKVQANPIAATYINKRSEYEMPSAKEISQTLGVEHKIVPVSSPFEETLDKMRWLAYLKDGLNYVAMSYILDFYATVASDLGSRIIGYTGDGGDKTLAPLGFNPSINSLKQLTQYLSITDRYFGWKEISRILDVDKKALIQHFETHLSSYPELTLEGKYKHFKIFERAFKLLAEGESRNRFFYWNITPFFSLPFFIEAMKIPEAAKRDGGLYRSFLSKINAECAAIRYPTSTQFQIIKKYETSLPIWLITLSLTTLERVKSLINKKEEGIEQLRHVCLTALDRCKMPREYFNIARTREIISRGKKSAPLFALLTLLLYMELIETELNLHP